MKNYIRIALNFFLLVLIALITISCSSNENIEEANEGNLATLEDVQTEERVEGRIVESKYDKSLLDGKNGSDSSTTLNSFQMDKVVYTGEITGIDIDNEIIVKELPSIEGKVNFNLFVPNDDLSILEGINMEYEVTNDAQTKLLLDLLIYYNNMLGIHELNVLQIKEIFVWKGTLYINFTKQANELELVEEKYNILVDSIVKTMLESNEGIESVFILVDDNVVPNLIGTVDTSQSLTVMQ